MTDKYFFFRVIDKFCLELFASLSDQNKKKKTETKNKPCKLLVFAITTSLSNTLNQ
jgi:hypothetical protein